MNSTKKTRTTTKRDQQLAAIAKTILDIPTLKRRWADHLDFHDVAVWQVEQALRQAYSAGYEAAVTELDPERVEPEDGCPRCGETATDNLVWQDDATVHCTNCGTRYRPGQRS